MEKKNFPFSTIEATIASEEEVTVGLTIRHDGLEIKLIISGIEAEALSRRLKGLANRLGIRN